MKSSCPRRRPVRLAVAILAAALVPGAWAQAPGAPVPAAPATGMAALPAAPQSSDIRALLVPAVESTLSSQIAGQVIELPFKVGETFPAGKPLVVFDCTVHKAQLRKARADSLAAQKTWQANLELARSGAVSNLEVDVSAARAQAARADVDLVAAQVELCVVHVPFAGRVAKLHVDLFESVTAGQPLISVLDAANLDMELYVPSRWLQWIKPGTRFKVTIDETGRSYPARVKALGARVDPVSQTLGLTAELVGAFPELLAGMSGVALFDVPK